MASKLDHAGYYNDPVSMLFKWVINEHIKDELKNKIIFKLGSIPKWLQDYWWYITKDHYLPYGWCRLWNVTFMFLTGYTLIQAISNKIYIFPLAPSEDDTPNKKTLTIKSLFKFFRIYLYLHITYYIIELLITRMYIFPLFTLHHLLSLLTFACLLKYYEIYPILVLTPIYIHSLSWSITDAEDVGVLFTYNVCSYISILSGLFTHIYLINKKPEVVKAKNFFIYSTVFVSLVCVNSMSYCKHYSSTKCGISNNTSYVGFNEYTLIVGLSSLLIASHIICNMYVSYYKLKDTPYFSSYISQNYKLLLSKLIIPKNFKIKYNAKPKILCSFE